MNKELYVLQDEASNWLQIQITIFTKHLLQKNNYSPTGRFSQIWSHIWQIKFKFAIRGDGDGEWEGEGGTECASIISIAYTFARSLSLY